MTLGIIVNVNNEKSSKQYAIWDEFLKKWPISKLEKMTLPEYNKIGDKETFCYWLDYGTKDLGSIGGPTFKFAIYNRKDEFKISSKPNHKHDGAYSWEGKYGETIDEVFKNVRSLIVEIAKAANNGALEEIEGIDYSPALKWKIAFLYQNRQKPTILPINSPDKIKELTDNKYEKTSECHKELIKNCPDGMDLLEYGTKLWSEGNEMKNEVGTELIELLKTIYPTDLESLEDYNNGMVLLYPVLKVLMEDETSKSDLETDDDHEKSDYYLDNVEQDDDKVENGQLFLKREALVTRVAGFLGFGGNENSIKIPRNKNHTMQSFSANAGENSLLKQIFIRLKIFNDNGTRYYKIASKQFSDIKNTISKFEENNGGEHKTAELIKACYYAVRNKALGLEGEEVSEKNSEAGNNTNGKVPLNQILYGPPGTGKTYNTAKIAVEICNGFVPVSRKDVMAEYKRLKDLGRISFTTFHQSMGYEDFIEGLRPEPSDDVNSSAFSLKPRKGIFKEICIAAKTNAFRKTKEEFSLNGKDIYKISLGEYKYGEDIYEAAIEGNYVVLGWETKGIDWTNSEYKNDAVALKTYLSLNESNKATDPEFSMPKYFNNMKIGDIVLVSAGNSEIRAIGEITGDYEFDQNVTGGPNKRSVKWLRIPKSYIPISEIYSKNFSMKSCYKMDKNLINIAALESYLNSNESNESEVQKQNYVLIIDEINRANISKVLGELITLLEGDKRLGAENELTVKLPYSGEEFGVPDNLYIIGTMNTADRSIAPIDTALRRRFEFTEMMPEYNLDDMGHLKDDNNIHKGKLLEAINHKIIEKYDRDHQIGHAYLINIDSKSKLDEVFRNKIIPLLQEYFYDNLQTIHDILGDGFIKIKDGKNYQVKDEFDYKKLLEMDNAGVNQSETEHNNDE